MSRPADELWSDIDAADDRISALHELGKLSVYEAERLNIELIKARALVNTAELVLVGVGFLDRGTRS